MADVKDILGIKKRDGDEPAAKPKEKEPKARKPKGISRCVGPRPNTLTALPRLRVPPNGCLATDWGNCPMVALRASSMPPPAAVPARERAIIFWNVAPPCALCPTHDPCAVTPAGKRTPCWTTRTRSCRRN